MKSTNRISSLLVSSAAKGMLFGVMFSTGSLVGACISSEDPFENQKEEDGESVQSKETGGEIDSQTAGTDDEGGEKDGSGPSMAEGDESADDGVDEEESGGESESGEGEIEWACPPDPSRVVSVGDSVAECSYVGGPEHENCGPHTFYKWIQETHESITYQNIALEGSVYQDVIDTQLDQIESDDGHNLVVLFLGGNDLLEFVYQSDSQAEKAYETLGPEVEAHLETILAALKDPDRFPGGSTIMLNSQFNPWDDCIKFPMSETKIGILHDYNMMVKSHADPSQNIYFSDVHAGFLGHGHFYEQTDCPHYMDGAEYFMEDPIHPNGAGNAVLFDLWKTSYEQALEACE